MDQREYSTKTWNQHVLNPKKLDHTTVDWYVKSCLHFCPSHSYANYRIFLVDLLNFSFWSDLDIADRATAHPDRYAVEYKGVTYTGYWSLCAAINRGKSAHQNPFTSLLTIFCL